MLNYLLFVQGNLGTTTVHITPTHIIYHSCYVGVTLFKFILHWYMFIKCGNSLIASVINCACPAGQVWRGSYHGCPGSEDDLCPLHAWTFKEIV